MRLDDMEIALGVAVEINVSEQVRRFRLDRDLIGYAGLPPQVTRTQVEQTVTPCDLGVIGVRRAVLDAVISHAISPNASVRNNGRCGGGGCWYWSRIASDNA